MRLTEDDINEWTAHFIVGIAVVCLIGLILFIPVLIFMAGQFVLGVFVTLGYILSGVLATREIRRR